jgi:hypothetical protein
MTTPPDPRGTPLPDDPMSSEEESDALVSAYLDGEVTAAERARVEADPVLLARLEQFRSVRSALADDIAAPAGAPDRLVTGALESYQTRTAEAATVTDLQTARGRRRPPIWVAGVAAAVAVLALIAVPLWMGDSGEDQFQDVGSALISSDAEGSPEPERGDADDAADFSEDASDPPAAAEEAAARSSEGLLVLVPLDGDGADANTHDAPADGAWADGEMYRAEGWPVELGRFPDRESAQRGVTAGVVRALAQPAGTDVGPISGASPLEAGSVHDCLRRPPTGAEHTGIAEPEAPVRFVGAFEQDGDRRLVVVMDLDDLARRAADMPADARHRVLEVHQVSCTLLGEQFL